MVDTVDDAPPVARRELHRPLWPSLFSRLRAWVHRLSAPDDRASLTDKDQRDIAAKPHDIGAMVDRDMAKLHTRLSRGH